MADYYVDPSIGTDTGSGTVGDPWGHTGNEIQKALDNITQGTLGDSIHVKSTGTVDFSGTDLSFATYGATTNEKPLAISGYTSAAWDGGVATIDLNGASTFVASTVDGLHFQDLDISGGTGSYQIYADSYIVVFRCTVDGGATTAGVRVGNYSIIQGNNITNVVGDAVFGVTSHIAWNYIEQDNNSRVLYCTGPIYNNIIKRTVSGNAQSLVVNTDAVPVFNNTIYSTVASTGTGIEVLGATENAMVYNNYVEGFSGAGGEGISIASGAVAKVVQNNRWYNCTTGLVKSGTVILDNDNSATTASGLTNAGSGDYTPTSELKTAGFPSGFLGLTGNAVEIDIGAIQAVCAASGGGGVGSLIGKGGLIR